MRATSQAAGTAIRAAVMATENERMIVFDQNFERPFPQQKRCELSSPASDARMMR